MLALRHSAGTLCFRPVFVHVLMSFTLRSFDILYFLRSSTIKDMRGELRMYPCSSGGKPHTLQERATH
jgi:hypothetical protein